jgi:hypothetical protein
MTIAGWIFNCPRARSLIERVEVMPIAKQLALPVVAVALFSSSVFAQNRSGGSGNGISGAGGHHSSVGISSRDGMRHRPFRRSPYFYGAPYFYSDYDSYEPEYQAPPPAPPTPAPVVPVKTEPLPDPVLLELRGNQWVKVTNFGETSAQGLVAESAVQMPLQKDMPPAVLIYRDGHSEEVSSYSIIGRVMYTKSDYWTSGAWTRTIQIADLDVPATLKQNQQRGVKFEMPSGPDEVVIRP